MMLIQIMRLICRRKIYNTEINMNRQLALIVSLFLIFLLAQFSSSTFIRVSNEAIVTVEVQ